MESAVTGDPPHLTIDPTGKQRYAKITFQGKTSRVRIPLHIFGMIDTNRQKTLLEGVLRELKERFWKEHKIKV